jgi:hypothetical protein
VDPADFDRLVARASDPRLIPGIYNYCDGRCPRCPFTERCLTYIDNHKLESAAIASSTVEVIGASLQGTLEIIAEVARREAIPLDQIEMAEDSEHLYPGADRHQHDPIVWRAREYGQLAWRVARALSGVVSVRSDTALNEAAGVIEWFSSLISSKVYRAIAGAADEETSDYGVQSDFDGSAKVALLGIAESRRAWDVLMEAGKATADGVPAQARKMLDALEGNLNARFPRAMDFVRPGFDEPEVAAGARSTRAPFDLGPRRRQSRR